MTLISDSTRPPLGKITLGEILFVATGFATVAGGVAFLLWLAGVL